MADGRRFITIFPREVFSEICYQFRYIPVGRILQYLSMKEM